MNNYFLYHLHSDYSLLDSATKFSEYADLVKDAGGTAIASTEHGLPRGWVSKKLYCDKVGLKFVHGVEIYLTRDLAGRLRDNYHTILLAKNYDGVKELNRLVSLSSQPDHFYYRNRISFDEFLGISDNIISTSACIAGPLCRLNEDDPWFMRLLQKYTFLEVQPHAHPTQKDYNMKLLRLSRVYGVPLVAGTDTHNSSNYKAECRSMILEAKDQHYGDEDSFDLTYKTYDELVRMFDVQGVLPETAYMEAIENTNKMADMCEQFELDTAVKYPPLHGSSQKDYEVYESRVWESLDEKINCGIIKKEHEENYREALKEELRVFKKLNMGGFMLVMSDLTRWCRENDIWLGPGRGSVCGSRAAYVTDITDVDPEVWHTVFSRFANEDRVEPPDVDTDVILEDRPKIFQYIIDRFGADKCARVAAYGTLANKSVIDLVCRVLLKKTGDQKYAPYNVGLIKKEYDADPDKTRKKYPEIFYYFDGLKDCLISQTVHAAGMVISPDTVIDNYGVFQKDGESCLLLDMNEAHDVGLVKYDFLALVTLKTIRDTCRMIGVKSLRMCQVNWDDERVWDDMAGSALTIFQMESDFAYTCMKRFRPKSIFDLCLVTASIRPSGTSYRNDLMERKVHKNSTALFDELLKENLGYLVYQEDVLNILQRGCGLSGSFADTVRRGIAKKKRDEIDAAMPQIIDGYCKNSDKPREVAEEEAKEIVKILEDASAYMFNKNHSVAYSMIAYICAYLRYYHPIEWITCNLNNAAKDEDIINGTNLMRRYGIKLSNPKFGISRSSYFFDKTTGTIYKGLSSIKGIGEAAARDIYAISQESSSPYFMDLLNKMYSTRNIKVNVINTLIRVDFFSMFGNQNELIRISELYEKFKRGEAKKVKRSDVDGTPLEPLFKKYAYGLRKDGTDAVYYTISNLFALLHESENMIKSIGFKDVDEKSKVYNYIEIMGYAGFMTGKEEDRPKLYVADIWKLKRKSDGASFARGIRTMSIGSGIESRFTVFDEVFNKKPFRQGDILYVKRYSKSGQYFTLQDYDLIS